MPLDQLTSYTPAAIIAAGLLMLLAGQRDRLKWLAAKLWPAAGDESADETASANEAEISAHEAYACLLHLLDEVETCPKATDALRLVVLPALASGEDQPHYRVTWEAQQ